MIWRRLVLLLLLKYECWWLQMMNRCDSRQQPDSALVSKETCSPQPKTQKRICTAESDHDTPCTRNTQMWKARVWQSSEIHRKRTRKPLMVQFVLYITEHNVSSVANIEEHPIRRKNICFKIDNFTCWVLLWLYWMLNVHKWTIYTLKLVWWTFLVCKSVFLYRSTYDAVWYGS